MFMRKPYALETYKKNLKKTGGGEYEAGWDFKICSENPVKKKAACEWKL